MTTTTATTTATEYERAEAPGDEGSRRGGTSRPCPGQGQKWSLCMTVMETDMQEACGPASEAATQNADLMAD